MDYIALINVKEKEEFIVKQIIQSFKKNLLRRIKL